MSKQHNTIIEINGRTYDVRTKSVQDASMLTPSHSSPAKSHATPMPKPRLTGTAQASFDVTQAQPNSGPSRAERANRLLRERRAAAAATEGIHKAVDRSQTLMRRAVKKPAATFKAMRPSAAIDGFAPVHHAGQPKAATLTEHQDVVRSHRARLTPKSTRISKFGRGQDFVVPAQPAAVPSLKVSVTADNSVRQPRTEIARSAAPASSQPATEHTASRTAEALIAQGLAAANSHTAEPLPLKAAKRRAPFGLSQKTFSISTAVLAVLFIGGFVAFQNIPRLSVHVASARAGIKAAMPTYTPAGYTMEGSAQAKPGEVRMAFKANADSSRTFELVQKSSNWSSEALLANYITSGNHNYQTYQDNGRTIYIYDKTNATWVNAGVWYNITGSSNLSSDQLIKIAKSL